MRPLSQFIVDWSSVYFFKKKFTLILKILFRAIWPFGAQISSQLHNFLGRRIELKAKGLK